MSCNSSHCHCPACLASRSPEIDWRDRAARCRAERNRVHTSMVDGAMVRWRWRCLPFDAGWIKKNVDTGKPFGPIYDRVTFTPTGFRAIGPKFSRTLGARQRSHYASWLRDRFTEREEVPVLSPLKLSILFWRAAHPISRPYPTWATDTMGGLSTALRELSEQQFIEFVGETSDRGIGSYKLTERAKVLMKAMALLPMPVREEAPWKMPEKDPLL